MQALLYSGIAADGTAVRVRCYKGVRSFEGMNLQRWKKLGERLSGMDRAELRERFRQEVFKRQDGVLSLLGFDFTRGERTSAGGGDAGFFFAPESIEDILKELQARIPGYADGIVAQADRICRHSFDMLGYTELDYGSPINWHLDAVHGKQAPRKLFHRIRYLDFAEVGDSKVTWEINRHQHLVTLAKAYRLTGNQRYADEILRQWRDWREANPYPVGINWASSLEAAFRSLAWLWTFHLLKGAAGLPEIRQEWLRGFALHGRHIERYLSTYFSPNTHLLGEGVGLFFLGILCPELTSAKHWQTLGWEIVLRESERQVQADGFHFEQSTYYHVYALDCFLHAAVLAIVNGIAIPQQFEGTIEKMLGVLCRLGRYGPPPSFGDDDGGRLFDPRRNRREHLLDPLSTGAILFQRGDLKFAAGSLREETIWLLGVEGIRQWDELEASPPDSNSHGNESGFYPFPANIQKCQLVFDAGPLGAGSGGHGHADALSVCLQAQGHALLIDPGTYQYIGPNDDRDLFRGTAIHNTLRVDAHDQAEPASPFSWKQLTRSTVDGAVHGEGFDLLVGSHDGYQRLAQPVIHRRHVISLRNGIYLVRDVVEGTGRHQIDISWHLGDGLQMEMENVYRMKGASLGLAVLPVAGHGWKEDVRRDSWSPAYGLKAPMTVLNFGRVCEVPAEFTTLLVTLEQVVGRPGEFSEVKTDAPEAAARAFRYKSAALEAWFFFARSDSAWQAGVVSSNAKFACWSQGADDRESLWFCKGTFASVDGGLELRCRRSVEWAELIVAGGKREVFSSDQAAVDRDAVTSN